mgnify:CR=1 FL=1
MGFGDGFNPSKSDVASSTKSGGTLSQTHQFTGSVFITSSGTSLSASNSISASAFIGDGSELTNLPGGGGGGAPTDAQYVVLATNGSLSQERVLTAGDGIALVDAGANGAITVSASADGGNGAIQFSSGSNNKFSGSSNLVYNYNADTLTFTGTLLLSSSDGVPIRVAEDEDATIIVGESFLGNGGSSGVAYMGHKDHQGGASAGFQQHSNGNSYVNAATNDRVIFAIGGSTKTQMMGGSGGGTAGHWGFGGGYSFIPGYLIDASGSVRLGLDAYHVLHITGAVDQSGSTATFNAPPGRSGAFAVIGDGNTDQGDPVDGRYFQVDTSIKNVRLGAGAVVDVNKKLWLGTGSLVTNPAGGVGDTSIHYAEGQAQAPTMVFN